jgi:chemotaxis response regulator CheB
LPAEACLCVVGATSLDGTTLLDIIKHLQPDTVILDETYLLTLSLERLIELLAYPQLRVITVSADDDRVQMCYKQQLRITRVADLVHLIRASKKMITGYAIPISASRLEV